RGLDQCPLSRTRRRALNEEIGARRGRPIEGLALSGANARSDGAHPYCSTLGMVGTFCQASSTNSASLSPANTVALHTPSRAHISATAASFFPPNTTSLLTVASHRALRLMIARRSW